MKRFLPLVIGMCLCTSLFSLDASLSYATFKSPQLNYIEIYLHIAGQTVEFAPLTDSTKQAGVEVLILFKQGENIVKFDKYSLNSPISTRPTDFIDLKRYALKNGEYQLIVGVTDINRPENAKEYNTKIIIDFGEDKVQQSGIQLLASYKKEDSGSPFVKNGILLEPLPYNFYGKNASSLMFYNEVYNTNTLDDDFLVSYSIEKLENDQPKKLMIGHKLKKPSPITPILLQMDISQLESGNYNLRVEIRSKTKELLSKKVIFFQRSNPYLEADMPDLAAIDLKTEFVGKLTPKQLEYSLRAMTTQLPQADVEVVNTMLKEKNLDAQRLYLFSFWVQRNPTNPEFAYSKYIEVANAIDKQFKSGFRYGFETDRGYIYMKYGQPDDIERREEEPSAPPYEVWSYNDFPQTHQTNVKFIFYNPSLAPGDFVLLHSNAIGEISNPSWEQELYRDANGNIGEDSFNKNANRVFRDY